MLTRYNVRNLAYVWTNILYVAGTVFCFWISDLMVTQYGVIYYCRVISRPMRRLAVIGDHSLLGKAALLKFILGTIVLHKRGRL